MWVSDITAGGGFKEVALFDAALPNYACNSIVAEIFTFTPSVGHTYELRVNNLDVPPNCTVDSSTVCTRWDVTFIGSKSGPALDLDMRI